MSGKDEDETGDKVGSRVFKGRIGGTKLAAEFEPLARGEKVKRPPPGGIHDGREEYAIRGVANGDARLVFDARVAELTRGGPDLSVNIQEAIALKLWEAGRVVNADALFETVAAIPPENMPDGEPDSVDTRTRAIWFRLDAAARKTDPANHVSYVNGEWHFRLKGPLTLGVKMLFRSLERAERELDEAPAQNERSRDEGPREDRPREDRPRDERPRDDRPRAGSDRGGDRPFTRGRSAGAGKPSDRGAPSWERDSKPRGPSSWDRDRPPPRDSKFGGPKKFGDSKFGGPKKFGDSKFGGDRNGPPRDGPPRDRPFGDRPPPRDRPFGDRPPPRDNKFSRDRNGPPRDGPPRDRPFGDRPPPRDRPFGDRPPPRDGKPGGSKFGGPKKFGDSKFGGPKKFGDTKFGGPKKFGKPPPKPRSR